jgi:hypothetical protein
MSGSSGRRRFTLRNRNRLAGRGRPSRRKQSQSWRRVAGLLHEGAVGVVWHGRPAPAKQCERGQNRRSILRSSALMLRSGGVHLKRLGPAVIRHADEETCAVVPNGGATSRPTRASSLASHFRPMTPACCEHSPTKVADGASSVTTKPATHRLHTSIAAVRYGRPIGSRCRSSTTITSTGVWSA